MKLPVMQWYELKGSVFIKFILTNEKNINHITVMSQIGIASAQYLFG
jgi:hypothetical protein